MATDQVEQIKERLDIVDLISSRVQLRRSGRNFKGLCPFHQEKTPSFVVFPDSQQYRCFGCGKGGDIFTFVMETDNLDFRDALAHLAQRAGVEIRRTTSSDSPRDERRERLIELNELAASYFSNLLWSGSSGQQAREIIESRGIDRRTAEAFSLGYAPDSWDQVKKHIQMRAGASEDKLVDAGLCSKSDNGRVYDRFRNRIMFPIRNRQGRVIGFGARAMGDDMPKYLNSPQSLIFNKSEALYAIDLAYPAIRRERSLIVVEGYMDAIAAHQYDYKNTVASMGTALTGPQVQSIKRYVDKVFVALDSDAAGQLATLRAVDTLRESFGSESRPQVVGRQMIRFERALDAEIRIVLIEQGKDPDDLIRSDIEAWEAALENSIPVTEYVLRERLKEVEQSPAARADALQEIAVPLLREVHDATVQSEYVNLVSQLLGYSDRDIRVALARRSVNSGTAQKVQSAERPSASNPEVHLVSLLLTYPLSYAARQGTIYQIQISDILDSRRREITDEILTNEGDLAAALENLSEEMREYADSLRELAPVRDDLTPAMADRELRQAIANLARQRYQERVAHVQGEINEARESGDREALREALSRMSELATAKPKFAPDLSPYFRDLRTPKRESSKM